MQSVKKIGFMMLVLFASFVLIPTPASVKADLDGDWEYQVEDGNATITKYRGSATEVTIPSRIAGYPVTRVGFSYYWDGVFAGNHTLRKVIIPNNVTSITDGAFRDCISLTDILIPNSVTEIGDRVFEGCISLSDIHIPCSVTVIGDYAFEGCTALENLNLPFGIVKIHGGAFRDCTSLKNVTLPDSLVTIGWRAFSDCKALRSIVIPNSVKEMEGMPFDSNIVILCNEGSYAQDYARRSNLVHAIIGASHTVTFTSEGVTVNVQQVESGKAATAPTNPTRTGYTFDGWDSEFDCISKPITVNAKWIVNTSIGDW